MVETVVGVKARIPDGRYVRSIYGLGKPPAKGGIPWKTQDE